MSIPSPTKLAERPPRRAVALRAFLSDRRGETAIEYGLIASLVVVVLLAGLTQFAGATNKLYIRLTNAMATLP